MLKISIRKKWSQKREKLTAMWLLSCRVLIMIWEILCCNNVSNIAISENDWLKGGKWNFIETIKIIKSYLIFLAPHLFIAPHRLRTYYYLPQFKMLMLDIFSSFGMKLCKFVSNNSLSSQIQQLPGASVCLSVRIVSDDLHSHWRLLICW